MVVFGLIKLLDISYSAHVVPTLITAISNLQRAFLKTAEQLLFIQEAHIQDQQVNNIYKQNFSRSSFFILRLLYRQIYR